MTVPKMRVGVIGVGHLGRHHARILSNLEDVELVAVADIKGDRAEQVGGPLGARATTDIHDLFGQVDAARRLIDGEAVRSCLVFAVQADGRTVDTVEGLASDGALHPLQRAFHEAHALQCGFCTPGILMTLVPFLRENPAPGERAIREALSGNLCRCTGYNKIVDAVLEAAETRHTPVDASA